MSEFASRAAQKLRQQDGKANEVLTFIRTSPFRANDQQYSRSVIVPLRNPTGDSALIAHAALLGLKRIYRAGFNYAKAGVMLLGLQDGSIEQRDLDLDPAPVDRGELMVALDRINERYGRATVLLASSGLKKDRRNWVMKQERRTPRYTTHWEEMVVART